MHVFVPCLWQSTNSWFPHWEDQMTSNSININNKCFVKVTTEDFVLFFLHYVMLYKLNCKCSVRMIAHLPKSVSVFWCFFISIFLGGICGWKQRTGPSSSVPKRPGWCPDPCPKQPGMQAGRRACCDGVHLLHPGEHYLRRHLPVFCCFF